MKSIPQVFYDFAKSHPDDYLQIYRDKENKLTYVKYSEGEDEIYSFASGLLSIGMKQKSLVGFISENKREWYITDMAILSINCSDVPKGTDSHINEIKFILNKTRCEYLVVENEKELDRILDEISNLPNIKCIIIADSYLEQKEVISKQEEYKLKIYTYCEILRLGKEYRNKNPNAVSEIVSKITPEDLATIIFTSGTTGEPKGVMLQHKGFLNQVVAMPIHTSLGYKSNLLCFLPIWHSFMRALNYASTLIGCCVTYSKPIGKIFLKDIKDVDPDWVILVPRVLEFVYQNIHKELKKKSPVQQSIFHFFYNVGNEFQNHKLKLFKLIPEFEKRNYALDFITSIIPYLLLYPLNELGYILVFKKIRNLLGRLNAVIGGAATPAYVSKFFRVVRFPLYEGYGLTENSPIISVMDERRPVVDTVGRAVLNQQVKVIDVETSKELGPGQKGVLYIKSPQVMQGYFENPQATKSVLSEDGWLNTGDLVMLTHTGEIKIAGREKDTIVLLGGENIEPTPIENKLKSSIIINNAVVIGSEKNFLTVLIAPERETLLSKIKELNLANVEGELSDEQYANILDADYVKKIYKEEIGAIITVKDGFKDYELIRDFTILKKPFEVGDELSAKQDIKRKVIIDKYSKLIENMYKR